MSLLGVIFNFYVFIVFLCADYLKIRRILVKISDPGLEGSSLTKKFK